MNKPFLKWAGGKSRIAIDIDNILPYGKRLVEPFIGSGAVFLNTDYEEYLLADLNNDLIDLYLTLQKEGSKFIRYCMGYFNPGNNTEEKYMTFRKEFNQTTDRKIKSAIFVYLNKHCFNGVCRYNSKGEFNVPFGSNKNPSFPKHEMMDFYLKSKRAVFKCSDFRDIMSNLKDGDVVYADPPYVPLSSTASFVSYISEGFNIEDQEALAEISHSCGRPVIISNHDTKITRDLYKNASAIESLEVNRSISCKGDKRESVKEIFALFNIERNDRKSQKNLRALFGHKD